MIGFEKLNNRCLSLRPSCKAFLALLNFLGDFSISAIYAASPSFFADVSKSCNLSNSLGGAGHRSDPHAHRIRRARHSQPPWAQARPCSGCKAEQGMSKRHRPCPCGSLHPWRTGTTTGNTGRPTISGSVFLLTTYRWPNKQPARKSPQNNSEKPLSASPTYLHLDGVAKLQPHPGKPRPQHTRAMASGIPLSASVESTRLRCAMDAQPKVNSVPETSGERKAVEHRRRKDHDAACPTRNPHDRQHPAAKAKTTPKAPSGAKRGTRRCEATLRRPWPMSIGPCAPRAKNPGMTNTGPSAQRPSN